MAGEFAAPDLLRLAAWVERNLGLHFPSARLRDLAQGLRQAARDKGDDPEAFLRALLEVPDGRADEARLEALTASLTVGETYFFREKRFMASLESHILPALIARAREGDRRLRIWSAGCCSGEEPYTLAMLVDRLLPDRKGWNISILGTDINPRFLHKAEEGVYSRWSFRDMPTWAMQANFRPLRDGKSYAISGRIREMVRFTQLNLAIDPYPSLAMGTVGLDLILCRNVFLYFSQEGIENVLARLHDCLAPEGLLAVGASEASLVTHSGLFEGLNVSESFLFRRLEACATIALPAEAFRDEDLPPFPLPEPDMTATALQSAAPGQPPPSEEDLVTEALLTESGALLQAGCNQEAAELLKGALDKGLTSAPAVRAGGLLAQALANLGDLAGAEAACRDALAVDRLVPELHFILASVLLEEGRAADAEYELRQTLFLEPDMALAHFTLGTLHRRNGHAADAVRDFANARELLARHADEEVPLSGGLTGRRLLELIAAMENV